MAKLVHGPNVGAVSGSVGNMTLSRGKYGAHMRLRSKGTRRVNASTTEARRVFGEASRLWGGLTAQEQASWVTWAQSNPVRDRLGQSMVLSGKAAFVELSCRLLRAGDAVVNTAPVVAAPVWDPGTLLSCDLSLSRVYVLMSVPLSGGPYRALVWAAIQTGKKVRRWQDALKLVSVRDSGDYDIVNIFSALNSRFGTPLAGQFLHVVVVGMDPATGLLGPPSMAEMVLVA